ncbi:MAG: hypothetical protein IKS69_01360, partial [Erysipelotrichaceae bacterium]|nr:hypothetical protein [Erysipelotrichaceae bacterium]
MMIVALFPHVTAAEEEPAYTLTGVAAHGVGFTEKDNTKKVKWENDTVRLIYDPDESSPDNITAEDSYIGLSYESGEIGQALEGDPQPGITYYACLTIRNNTKEDHSVDFSQLTLSSIHLVLDGFAVEVLECVEDTNDDCDQLHVYYSLTKYQATYHLKGVSLHCDSFVEQGGYWGPDLMEGSMIWDGEEPVLIDNYLFANSLLYADAGENTPLTSEPSPGQTCYFVILVQNTVADDHSIDFIDHLDVASMNITITDYTVQYRNSTYYDLDGNDAVLLHFSARRKNHNLYLIWVIDNDYGEVIAEPLEAEE